MRLSIQINVKKLLSKIQEFIHNFCLNINQVYLSAQRPMLRSFFIVHQINGLITKIKFIGSIGGNDHDPVF